MKDGERAGGYIGEALGEASWPRPTTGTRDHTRGCRHGQAWVICSGLMLWCPECGGIRALERTGPASGKFAWSGWVKPDGQERACARHDVVTKGKR